MRLSTYSIVSIYLQISAATAATSSTGTSIVSCNPLSATACSPDPALATSISDDFKEASENYAAYRYPSGISYGSDGLSLTLAERFDNPSLVSDFYMMFGKVEVSLKSASGTGIISSFYLQSDDLDEIDLEWMGGDASQMQSNFFSKGDTTTYDRGEYHNMSDPRADFHNYTLDWNEDSLSWYIDGSLVRTLSKDSASGYPQTPMRIYFGIWAGGDSSNSEGTIEWAGGLTDYSQAPFVMHINSLIAADYSTGTEYSYNGTDGTWQSIVAKNGEVNGREAIAKAEFASLVQGNAVSSNTTVVSAANTTSVVLSSAVAAESHVTSTGQYSYSKTTGSKSEFLSSSTLTSKTQTHSGNSTTTKHSSSSSSSETSTSSVSTISNVAASNVYSGAFALFMFLISLF